MSETNKESITDHIRSKRREFSDLSLSENEVNENPFEQFKIWMSEAVDAQILDPYAMCLATIDEHGAPDSRVVYLRDITAEGFVFYTNYQSDKAIQIGVNPNVSLNFLWNELSRQVKIRGLASKAGAKLSDAYFDKRPRASKIGAWASDQSKVLNSRTALEDQLIEVEKRFEGKEVSRPPHWGGFIVKPAYFEFWKGRRSRLHDRLVYKKEKENWSIKRLSP